MTRLSPPTPYELSGKPLSPRQPVTDRPTRVLILLQSFLDWLPSPRGVRFASEPGPAPTKVRCGRCSGAGRVAGEGDRARPCQTCRVHVGRHGCRLCLACDGTGWRKARRGEKAEDPTLNPGQTETLEDSNRRTDTRIRLEALYLPQHEADPVRLEEVERAVDYGIREQRRMWAEGSYRELGWCLSQLSEAWPRRSALVWRHLIYAEGSIRSERVERVLGETLDWIAERMPAEVRVPGHLEPKEVATNGKTGLWRQRTARAAELREVRDEHIRRQWLALGWDVQQIAEMNALSERRVQQILGLSVSGMASGTAA